MMTERQLQTLHNMGNESERAAEEIECLMAELEAVKTWQAQGEALFVAKNKGFLFSLGEWWADRPWR